MFEETAARFTEVLNINLVGTFLLVQCAARHMIKQQRGSIICTASVAGLRSGAGGIPYSASKAGVISLVQTVANQLDKIGQLNPLQRNGLPEEIAQMALLLASEAASYVNGQAIAVDGGLSSSHPVVISRR